MICRICHHAHRPGRGCLDAERQRLGAAELRARQPPRDTRRAIRQGLREAFAADIAEMADAARQPAADGPTTEGSALVTGACDFGFDGQAYTKVWVDEANGPDQPVVVMMTKETHAEMIEAGAPLGGLTVVHHPAAKRVLSVSAAHLLDQDPQP